MLVSIYSIVIVKEFFRPKIVSISTRKNIKVERANNLT